MKSLEQYNNMDKAELLFRLFPEEIPQIVDFIGLMSLTVLEDQERGRAKWKNGLFTFDLWISWAKEANDKVAKYGTRLYNNKRLFTDQLFDGYVACFTNHCIQVLITTMQHKNARFIHAVHMLYNF